MGVLDLLQAALVVPLPSLKSPPVNSLREHTSVPMTALSVRDLPPHSTGRFFL